MGKLRWYKRDPDAAINGMRGLSLEECGAYNLILDLIYSRAGDVPDDDREIAHFIGVDIRVWKRIKARLLKLGKLSTSGGLLANFRAKSEIARAIDLIDKAQQAGQMSAAKRRAGNSNTNDLASTPVPTPVITTVATDAQRPYQQPTPTTTPTKKVSGLFRNDDEEQGNAVNSQFSERFEEFWKAYPRRDGSNPKQPASKIFATAVKSGHEASAIIAGAVRYAEFMRSKGSEGTAYVAQAQTWLRQARWTDELPAANGHGPAPAEAPIPREKLEPGWAFALERENAADGAWQSQVIHKADIPQDFIDKWRADRKAAGLPLYERVQH